MDKIQVANLTANDQAALEIIIIGLYRRQTKAEKARASTMEDNDMGFSKRTDKNGSRLARWLVDYNDQPTGRHLTGYHIQKAREIATHHWRQVEGCLKEHAARAFPRVVQKVWNRTLPRSYTLPTDKDLNEYLAVLDPFQETAFR